MASMKTIFSMGFQAHNPFSGRHPGMGQFSGLQSPSLGRGLSASEIDAYMKKITEGRQKLARIEAWIESKKAAQPFGWTLFGDNEALQANFFNWQKTAASEEGNVARVWSEITNPTTADYDVASEDLILTNDWATQINWMTGAMEDYGGVKPTPTIAKRPMIDPRTGLPMPTTMPTAQTSTVGGIPTGTLVLGGAALLAAIGIAALLKA
jgi:hypothetical protein